MSFFKAKVDEFDPGKTLTGTFVFDGAANVQKAGQILCAHLPRQCDFMEGNIFCHYFLVTYQELVQ